MITSGTTAISTSGTGNVALLTAPNTFTNWHKVIITNEGQVAGFFSLDGGASWVRLPAAPSGGATIISIGPVDVKDNTVLVKRDTSASSDMTGLYAAAIE